MNLHEAKRLACDLMIEHELWEWKFGFDNAKQRFGQCRHRDKTITLSRHLVAMNDEYHVRDTILHEIAHALVGPGHGHNSTFYAMCLKVGAEPNRCYDTNQVAAPPHNYEGICPVCGVVAKRHRLRKATAHNTACGRHGNSYNPRYRLTWRKVK